MASDFASRDIRILATDLSARVLVQAKTAEYPLAALSDIPVPMRRRFTSIVPGAHKRQFFRIHTEIRALVSFARLNLMDDWPMQRSFDIIFCRNVMIYFDRETQQQLVQRFWKHTTPGGHFFVGHSESLTPLRHSFRGLRPAVYTK
jgi:chemotaxis protein methyltransferase CheR